MYDQLEEEVKVVFDVFSKRLSEQGINIHFGLCYHDKYDTLKELRTKVRAYNKVVEEDENYDGEEASWRKVEVRKED